MKGWELEYLIEGESMQLITVRCICGHAVYDDTYDESNRRFICGNCGTYSPITNSMNDARIEKEEYLRTHRLN